MAEWLAAAGTVAVAFIAIWGEWVRSILAPPRAELQHESPRPSVEQFPNGTTAVYYHLRVENRRRWITLRNCRVLLTRMQRREPDGTFRLVPLPVPLQLAWAPRDFSPTMQTLSSYAVLDFGFVISGSDKFQPSLYVTPHAFQGFVHANESVRYFLEIMCDGMAAREFAYEVTWNGKWSEDPDEMAQNLTVFHIESADKKR